MSKLPTLFALLVTHVLLVSCGRVSIINIDEVNLVKPDKVVTLDVDTNWVFDVPQIVNPNNLQIVQDSILIVQDQVSNSDIFHFKAFGLNPFKYVGSIIPNGRAEGEMISPHIAKMLPSEDYLYLSQNSSGDAFAVDVNTSLMIRNTHFIDEFDLLPSIVDWLPLDDSKAFALLYENNEFVCHVVDKEGETLRTFELFKSINASLHSTYLSQYMIYNRYLNKVAVPMIFFPQITILDIENEDYFSIAVDKEYRNWEAVISRRLDMNTIQYYTGLSASPDYLFAVYRKVPLGMLSKSLGSSVHVFNWDGSLKYDIRVKENISQIAYDDFNNYLYCIDKVEGRIVRYNLETLL